VFTTTTSGTSWVASGAMLDSMSALPTIDDAVFAGEQSRQAAATPLAVFEEKNSDHRGPPNARHSEYVCFTFVHTVTQGT
jgi:hypothetical protein